MPPNRIATKETGLLPRRAYLAAIKALPITTLDLIIRNHKNEVLLGWRKNEPARDSWFNPGGRLFKNERIQDGLRRIFQAELGLEPVFKQPKFLGAFEMFFETNFAGAEGVSTHNIALAYEIRMGAGLSRQVFHTEQHSDYRWFGVKALLKSPAVHPAVKAYFRSSLSARTGPARRRRIAEPVA